MAATHFIDIRYPLDDKESQFKCAKLSGNVLKQKQNGNPITNPSPRAAAGSSSSRSRI